jgi:BirA family transcriptional regulator, biotin operon repressor / biotin---[acetyl-CoA-carboxylase] ligase
LNILGGQSSLSNKVICPSKSSVPLKLLHHLDTTILGKRIYYYKKLDSTQAFAISMSEKKLLSKNKGRLKEEGIKSIHGTIIIAEEQKNGRGRYPERKWISPQGGIWLSIILVPKIDAAQSAFLSFISAISVCDTIVEKTNLNPKIRWPNDIVIQGRKVSGIIVNVSTEQEKINYAIIGIGINVNVDSSRIVGAFVDNAENNMNSDACTREWGITTLKEERYGKQVDIVCMMKYLLEKLEYYYNQLERQGTHNIRNEWKKRADTLGRLVKVKKQGGIIEGIALDVDGDGVLLVKTEDGNIQQVI